MHNSTSLCCCGLSSHLASAGHRPSKSFTCCASAEMHVKHERERPIRWKVDRAQAGANQHALGSSAATTRHYWAAAALTRTLQRSWPASCRCGDKKGAGTSRSDVCVCATGRATSQRLQQEKRQLIREPSQLQITNGYNTTRIS